MFFRSILLHQIFSQPTSSFASHPDPVFCSCRIRIGEICLFREQGIHEQEGKSVSISCWYSHNIPTIYLYKHNKLVYLHNTLTISSPDFHRPTAQPSLRHLQNVEKLSEVLRSPLRCFPSGWVSLKCLPWCTRLTSLNTIHAAGQDNDTFPNTF